MMPRTAPDLTHDQHALLWHVRRSHSVVLAAHASAAKVAAGVIGVLVALVSVLKPELRTGASSAAIIAVGLYVYGLVLERKAIAVDFGLTEKESQ